MVSLIGAGISWYHPLYAATVWNLSERLVLAVPIKRIHQSDQEASAKLTLPHVLMYASIERSSGCKSTFDAHRPNSERSMIAILKSLSQRESRNIVQINIRLNFV